MLAWICLSFLMLIERSLCSCDITRDLTNRIAKAEQMSSEEILSLMFPDIKTPPSRYHFDHPLILPSETWLTIFKGLDAFDLWSLGLANKYLGALVRSNQLIKAEFLKALWNAPTRATYNWNLQSIEARILTFIQKTELAVHWYHRRLLKYEQYQHLNLSSSHFGTMWHSLNPSADYRGIMITASRLFLERTNDLDIVHLLVGSSKLRALSFNISNLEEVFVDENPDGHARYFYFPVTTQRLFETISPKIVARAIFSGSKEYREMFIPAIITNYIVQAWNNKGVRFPKDEMEAVCAIIHFSPGSFSSYFEDLVWAIYFATGSVNVTEPTLVKPIKKFLETFGIDWRTCNSKSRTNKWHAKNKEYRVRNMNATFVVAHQWGIDINKIAAATPNDNASKEILAGRTPKILETDIVSQTSLTHFVLYGNITLWKMEKPVEIVPMNNLKRKFVNFTEEGPELKRQCTDQNCSGIAGQFGSVPPPQWIGPPPSFGENSLNQLTNPLVPNLAGQSYFGSTQFVGNSLIQPQVHAAHLQFQNQFAGQPMLQTQTLVSPGYNIGPAYPTISAVQQPNYSTFDLGQNWISPPAQPMVFTPPSMQFTNQAQFVPQQVQGYHPQFNNTTTSINPEGSTFFAYGSTPPSQQDDSFLKF